jgi:hypothetical protein
MEQHSQLASMHSLLAPINHSLHLLVTSLRGFTFFLYLLAYFRKFFSDLFFIKSTTYPNLSFLSIKKLVGRLIAAGRRQHSHSSLQFPRDP